MDFKKLEKQKAKWQLNAVKLIPLFYISSVMFLLLQQLPILDIPYCVFSSIAVRLWPERQLETMSLAVSF